MIALSFDTATWGWGPGGKAIIASLYASTEIFPNLFTFLLRDDSRCASDFLPGIQ